MSSQTDRLCSACERRTLNRGSLAGLSWLECPVCDKPGAYLGRLHLRTDDGLLCDAVWNAWDRYERLSADPAVLEAQLRDRDLCRDCWRAWLNGEHEADDMSADGWAA